MTKNHYYRERANILEYEEHLQIIKKILNILGAYGWRGW